MTWIINRSYAWIYCPLIRSRSRSGGPACARGISPAFPPRDTYGPYACVRSHRHMTLFSAWLIGRSMKYRLQFSSTSASPVAPAAWKQSCVYAARTMRNLIDESVRLASKFSVPRHFATLFWQGFAVYLWRKRKRRSYDGIVSQHPRTRNFMPLFAPLFESSATRKRNDARGIKSPIPPRWRDRESFTWFVDCYYGYHNVHAGRARTILLTIVNEENCTGPLTYAFIA